MTVRERPSDNRELMVEVIDLIARSADAMPIPRGHVVDEHDLARLRAELVERRAAVRSWPPIPDQAMLDALWGMFQLFVDRSVTDDQLDAERVSEAFGELERRTLAGVNGRQRKATRRRDEIVALRAADEKIDYIVRRVGVKKRRVYEVLAEEKKKQRD